MALVKASSDLRAAVHPYIHVKGKHASSRATSNPGILGLTGARAALRYSDESIAVLSQAAARAYAAGDTLPHPKTEKAAEALLARHGVAFVHQHVIVLPTGRAVVVDFFLPGRNVAIEVDTPYTHRKARRDRDAKRDEALGALGVRVLRVHDDGVPEHVARAVLLAAVGDSSPYGGSVTTESTDASGRVRSTSRQSPWCSVTPWP